MSKGLGAFNDGQTAGRHQVTVQLDADGVHIAGREVGHQRLWPYADLCLVEPAGVDAALRLTSNSEPDTRLQLNDPGLRAVLERQAPQLFTRGLTQPNVCRSLVLIVVVLSLVGLVSWLGVPRLSVPLAQLIPISWEQDIGLAVLERLLGNAELCGGSAGQAALSRLTERLLTKVEQPPILTISVADHNMINAFAMPGGQIVIMQGLIEQAETADQVAAVLAHEIGHVHHRHPTQLAIRTVGIGLLGELITDDGPFLVELATEIGGFLLLLGYNREMEREADDYGRALLAQAGLSTDAMVQFFHRLRDAEPAQNSELLEYLSSHPPLDERITASGTAKGNRPALNDEEWRDLQSICG